MSNKTYRGCIVETMPAPRALALFNPATTNIWLELPDGTSRPIGTARNRQDAYHVLGQAGLIRTGNWLPQYGPVVSATVWTEVPA